MNKDDLIIKKTKNGKGVFAGRNFRKGERILEFHGEFFTDDELPMPYDEVEDHYVQIDRNLYMGPSGGADDFFNHSCDPNAGLKIKGRDVFIVAIKNILKGNEVAWDYSTTMDETDWEMDCACESRNCRHHIRDFKYLSKDVQQKCIRLGIVPEYISKNFRKKIGFPD